MNRARAVDKGDPRQLLARRLRALREERWPDMKLTQPQLARALGGSRPLSVPLISSWESQGAPKIPPVHRLEAYAAFFATPRSVATGEPRMLGAAEMTDAERQARLELTRELMRLRNDALRATGVAEADEISRSLSAGPWRFEDGNTVTVVCARLPPDMREKMPYADRSSPDYIELYNYSDLDALFELHGHLRASNPTNQVNLRVAQQLVRDDYTTHLVALGGVDWNQATRSVLENLHLPVTQVGSWKSAEGPCFEVTEGGKTEQHRPILDQRGEQEVLVEDVALFARAINPFNRKRTVTICNGMYGNGTYGAVRALTDERFRDRNAEYIHDRFAGSESYSILTRVKVLDGAALTPDWTIPENRLHEWPGPTA
jgi:transcriptional regulator with XRE-family HTH domain